MRFDPLQGSQVQFTAPPLLLCNPDGLCLRFGGSSQQNNMCMHTHTRTHAHTHTLTLTHTHTHTCIHTHTHIHTHIHTHTHMHKCADTHTHSHTHEVKLSKQGATSPHTVLVPRGLIQCCFFLFSISIFFFHFLQGGLKGP